MDSSLPNIQNDSLGDFDVCACVLCTEEAFLLGNRTSSEQHGCLHKDSSFTTDSSSGTDAWKIMDVRNSKIPAILAGKIRLIPCSCKNPDTKYDLIADLNTSCFQREMFRKSFGLGCLEGRTFGCYAVGQEKVSKKLNGTYTRNEAFITVFGFHFSVSAEPLRRRLLFS